MNVITPVAEGKDSLLNLYDYGLHRLVIVPRGNSRKYATLDGGPGKTLAIDEFSSRFNISVSQKKLIVGTVGGIRETK